MNKVKTFLRALQGFARFPQKTRVYLQDRRLSVAEKKILQSFFYLRDNKLEEATKCLEGIPQELDPLVQGPRQLITGIIAISQTRFQDALVHLQQAKESLAPYSLPYFNFLVLANLFVVHLNLHNKEEMKKSLVEMDQFSAKTDWQKLYTSRSHFNFEIARGQYQEALRWLKEVEKQFHAFSESDHINHLVSRFDLMLKLGNYSEAKKSLDELKNHRKYRLSANFNFMKVLLLHLLENAPIYLENEDFKDCSMLFYQIQVIKALEEQNLHRAKMYWDKLQLMTPNLHQKDWNYTGEICLFSLCLKKYESLFASGADDVGKVEGESYYEKLKNILLASPGKSWPRAELYEAIWGYEYSTKDELKKLTQYVYLLRIKEGFDIQTRKGCYQLLSLPKQKSA